MTKKQRDYLVGKMKTNGYSIQQFLKLIGMSSSTFYKKARENSQLKFDSAEIALFGENLKLTDEEIVKIFIAKDLN